MTATLPDVAAKKKPAEQSAEQQAAGELVRLAKEQGLSLTVHRCLGTSFTFWVVVGSRGWG
jgi:hypothetical protein